LIKYGFSKTTNGKKTRTQSKHFVCTSCHNLVKEDPNLAISDPASRLNYAVKNDLPFLQGTTLYGAVNRTTYYNGDYEKKYGDLVKPARNDIREAIKLCAVECAQGRKLKKWEVESILAYLWTIDLKVNDLNFTDNELKQLSSDTDHSESIELINSKYLSGAPATFTPPPADRKSGYSENGNPENGELIYKKSCLHCHENGKYSYLFLDDSKMSLNHLERHAGKYSPHSIYQVIRWGVPTYSGRRSYMPQYTLEKMSNQQVADLRAYIDQ